MTSTSGESIDVVPMRMDHVKDVLDLGFRIFDVTAMPYTSWSLSSVAAHLDTQPEACWVAIATDEVLGFVLGSMSFDEREDWGYLEWIALDQRARGTGVASTLVEACCQALFTAGARRIITDVEQRNAASARMMQRNGFTEGVTVTLLVRRKPYEPTTSVPPAHARSGPQDPARARLRTAARRLERGSSDG